ncbi:MAG TPA: VOC family protein [Candidatus Limnocylindria bacterium]|nr:VOC family protein [Candidatus Limnocylindria bacterium]
MPGAIDHLVIAVADPDAAARELEAKLGIAATGGGDHRGVGTYNRLAFLGDAYLELIGVRDEAAATRWPVGAATLRALRAGGGLATYAVLDDQLDVTVARLRGAGSTIGQVTPGSRTRPDGEKVEWWTATVDELGPERPPFLIQHAYAGAEWGDEALERRRRFVHPVGTPVVLAGLDIPTGDPASLAETYARDLGLSFASGPDPATLEIGPHEVRLLPHGTVPVVHLVGGAVAVSAELIRVRFELTPPPGSAPTS